MLCDRFFIPSDQTFLFILKDFNLNLKMNKFVCLNNTSPLGTCKDLMDCLIEGPTKYKKRAIRLGIVFDILRTANRYGILTEIEKKIMLAFDNDFTSFAKECTELIRQEELQKQSSYSFKKLTDQIEEMARLVNLNPKGMQVFSKDDYEPNSPLRMLEKVLTDAINHSDFKFFQNGQSCKGVSAGVYNYGCIILKLVEKTIKNDRRLAKYCVDGNILVQLKGGMAQRLCLFDYIENVMMQSGGCARDDPMIEYLLNRIDKYFGAGDNDSCIYINPRLSKREFDFIIDSIIRIIEKILEYLTNETTQDGKFVHWYKKIFEIDQINCFDFGTQQNDIFSVKPGFKKSFRVESYNSHQNVINTTGKARNTFWSTNHTLSFDKKYRTSFVLCRWKACLQTTCGSVCAELLDISIPRQDDHKLLKFCSTPKEEIPFMFSKLLVNFGS